MASTKSFSKRSVDPVWLHGQLSDSEAESLFGEMPVPEGQFLVRKCESEKAGYILTVVENKKIEHYQLVQGEMMVGADCSSPLPRSDT